MNALPLLTAAVFCSFSPSAFLCAQEPASPPKKEAGNAAKSPVQAKAEKLVIPRIAFAESEISDVLAYISKKARDVDGKDQSGVNIVLHADKAKVPPFTADIRNVSVWDVLTAVSNVTGLQMSVVGETILIHSANMAPKERKGSGLTDSAEWKAQARTRIERISFAEADLTDVVAHYSKKASEAGKPLNLVLAVQKAPPVTLDMHNAALTDILEMTAELAGQEITACGNIIIMRPWGEIPAKPAANKAEAAPEWKKSDEWKRAESIIIDRVSFAGAAGADVAAHLTKKSQAGDKESKGVRIAISNVADKSGISLDVRKAKVSDILLMLAELHGLEISVKEGEIRLGML